MRPSRTPEPIRVRSSGRAGTVLFGALGGLLATAAPQANAQSASASASGIVHGYGVGLMGLSVPISVSVNGQNGDVALSNGVGAVLSGALLAASSQGLIGSGGVGAGVGGVQSGPALTVDVSSAAEANAPRATDADTSSAPLNGQGGRDVGR